MELDSAVVTLPSALFLGQNCGEDVLSVVTDRNLQRDGCGRVAMVDDFRFSTVSETSIGQLFPGRTECRV